MPPTTLTTRNAIIVHGCPDDDERSHDPLRRTYNKHWMPWLRNQLIARGITATTPLMPEPWKPDYPAYCQTFAHQTVTPRTILIGHSCGASFLVRWLGDTKQPIDTLMLVAPWKVPKDDGGFREQFYTYDIDPTLPTRVRKIVIFTSDNEEADGKKSAQIFHQALGGQLIELPNHGHYVFSAMKTEEFPELLECILN